MSRTTHENLAAAIGAFVTAEAIACIANPRGMLNEEGYPANQSYFHGVAFMNHLNGGLDDLIDICTDPKVLADPPARCTLLIEAERDDNHEWYAAMCGYVRIELAG